MHQRSVQLFSPLWTSALLAWCSLNQSIRLTCSSPRLHRQQMTKRSHQQTLQHQGWNDLMSLFVLLLAFIKCGSIKNFALWALLARWSTPLETRWSLATRSQFTPLPFPVQPSRGSGSQGATSIRVFKSQISRDRLEKLPRTSARFWLLRCWCTIVASQTCFAQCGFRV